MQEGSSGTLSCTVGLESDGHRTPAAASSARVSGLHRAYSVTMLAPCSTLLINQHMHAAAKHNNYTEYGRGRPSCPIVHTPAPGWRAPPARTAAAWRTPKPCNACKEQTMMH